MSTLQRRRMMMAQGVTYEGIPLTITNVSDNNVVISIRIYGGLAPLLYYKKGDRKTYRRWNYNNITLQPHESIDIFGDNPNGFSKSKGEYANFNITGGAVSIGGRISALSATMVNFMFYNLFYNCNVANIEEDLFEGIGTLKENCFHSMFQNCTRLTDVPYNLLPFTTLSSYCYYQMFANTGLTKIKSGFLPATSVPINAYGRMFINTKIDTIEQDAIAATYVVYAERMFSVTPIDENSFQEGSLKKMISNGNGAFTRMFESCKFSKIPPQIQLEARNNYVYQNTFENNKQLIELDSSAFNSLNITDSGARLYGSTFDGCTSLQKVEIPFNQSKVKGHDRLFQKTFNNCSSLNEIKVHFTSWQYQASVQGVLTTFNLTEEWLTNVSPTGTFICPKELAEATDGYYDEEGNFVAGVGRGVDTVPAGWYIDFPIIDARDGDTNAMALLTALVEYGLCPRGEYLMNSEADAIGDINSVFKGNTQITDFTAFQFFNGIKKLGAGNEATSPFAGSTLTRIILPDTLNVINNYAFYNCSALEYVSIGKNITIISDRAFYLCKNLSRADYRGTLEGWLKINIWFMGNPMVIGADLYINGELLAGDIVIPESITYIKQRILEGGKYITSITINHEITGIALNAFAGCSSLAYIVLNSNTPPTLQSSAIPSQTIIYVPDDSFDTYKSANVWSTIASRIKPISELPQE